MMNRAAGSGYGDNDGLSSGRRGRKSGKTAVAPNENDRSNEQSRRRKCGGQRPGESRGQLLNEQRGQTERRNGEQLERREWSWVRGCGYGSRACGFGEGDGHYRGCTG